MRVATLTFYCALTVFTGFAGLAQASDHAGSTTPHTPHEKLSALAEDFTYTTAKLFPTQATFLGIRGHDGELAAPSEAFRASYIARLQGWQAELAQITAQLPPDAALADRDDARILGANLTAQLNGYLVYESDRKDYGASGNEIVNVLFTQFQYLPIAGRDGAKAADVRRAWVDITRRLERTPGYIRASTALVTQPCHLFGVIDVQQLAGAPEFINGALSEAARQQLGEHDASYRRFIRARDAAVAALGQLKSFIDSHLGSWPENYVIGRQAYDRLLRDEQLLPFESADIERMARDELAHGWAEEAWLQDIARRKGTPLGAASGGGMAPSGAPLIDYYRDRIAELRNFVAAEQVVTLPQWLGVLQIVETPPFLQPVSPGASMQPPRLFAASGTGHYYITPPKSLEQAAATLDMNQDFDHDRIISTAAHEAMPGHFLQTSIARRHPDFVRKIQSDNVFVEGWAFYGEEMFVRLGLYGPNLDARLATARWERVRGARALVDPRLMSGEWNYEQSVQFYEEQTGFTHDAAAAAVAMVATRPGYVIAYTVGRYQIETLLAQYMKQQKEHASLRDFHDRLLSYGAIPLALLGPELMADLDKPSSAVRAAANY
jgi:uncharacterized protein (DUF885 family)